MEKSHIFISYLMLFFIVIANIEQARCGEYHEYESKHYDHHHHDYHPPAKKGANIDINIPLDLGTIAKLGVLGLSQLQLLLALGKVAGAGLGVSVLGLGHLGKIALKVGPVHKGAGIAIDVGGPHHHVARHYDHHHHDYHPPAKKAANIDINIPLDFGTIAKLGVLGLTQLKILLALGKVAGAGLGVSALGLGQLGKIGLKVGHAHKGAGIAIDVGGPHHHVARSHHSHYEPEEKHYHVPSEKHY